MKKLKHESELFKAALLAGVQYAEGRKAVEFEATDSASDKALYVYRLLVHDKVIAPMPEEQVSEKTIRHRLDVYQQQTQPLIAFYADEGILLGLDATGPVEEITDRALSALRRFIR